MTAMTGSNVVRTRPELTRTNSDITYQNLEAVRNTDGVLEAWIGYHNTYYITLTNLRVLCLRESQLPSLTSYILQSDTEEAETSPTIMPNTSSSGVKQTCSHPEKNSSSFSLNIKNKPVRDQPNNIKQKSLSGKNQAADKDFCKEPLRHDQSSFDRKVDFVPEQNSANADPSTFSINRLKASRLAELEKWTEIATSYLEAMGVVQEVEPLDILTTTNWDQPGLGYDFESINSYSMQEEIHSEQTHRCSHSFLPNSTDCSFLHAEERTLAGSSGTNGVKPCSVSLNRTQTSTLACKASQLEHKNTVQSKERMIKVPCKKGSKGFYISGANTLGGLPENKPSLNVTHQNSRKPRRTLSAPTNPFKGERSLLLKHDSPSLSLDKTRGDTRDELINETVSEPTSRVSGIEFIVGGRRTFPRNLASGNRLPDDLSSDFTSNSASFFSSMKSSQEKAGWIKDSPCSSLSSLVKNRSKICAKQNLEFSLKSSANSHGSSLTSTDMDDERVVAS